MRVLLAVVGTRIQGLRRWHSGTRLDTTDAAGPEPAGGYHDNNFGDVVRKSGLYLVPHHA